MASAHQRRNKTRLIAAAATLAVTAILAFSLKSLSRADALDAWWLRARFALREKLQTPTPDKDIVLVEMDDRSLAHWKEPTILWGPHLAAAVENLTRSGVRLVAFDWIQPESIDNYIPGHDEPLVKAISRAPDVVLVKGFAPDGSETVSTQMLYAIPDAYQDPQAYQGFAELPKNESIIASLRPQFERENKEIDVAFAARIAQRFKRAPRPLPIPLRADGTFLINYRSGSGRAGKYAGFQRYSLYDVAQLKNPDSRFKDKIAILGATFNGSNDSHYAPIGEGFARARLVNGLEIQANAARTILDSRPIREPDSSLSALLALVPALICIVAWLRLSFTAATLVSLGVGCAWIALGFAFFARDFALPISLPLLCVVFASAAMGGARALGEERERRAVLGLWGRYQDPRLVDYLLDHPGARGGHGTETEVTVLFADLKNFTKTVQHLEPEAALEALNRYLSLMTDVIRDEYGGVIDKYLGDGLMAQWGAPRVWETPKTANEHHAASAIRACLELQRRARALTAELGTDVTFGLRLTLHTGPVVMGWVGAQRIEYTIIGDTVNVCARLQETAKELDCEFLISQSTHDFGRTFVGLQIGKTAEVAIRGRDKPLCVYEVREESAGGESVATCKPL